MVGARLFATGQHTIDRSKLAASRGCRRIIVFILVAVGQCFVACENVAQFFLARRQMSKKVTSQMRKQAKRSITVQIHSTPSIPYVAETTELSSPELSVPKNIFKIPNYQPFRPESGMPLL
jgi:hypothetical protein